MQHKHPGRTLIGLTTQKDRSLPSGTLWTQRGGVAGLTAFIDASFEPSGLSEAWTQTLGYTHSDTGWCDERVVAIDENHICCVYAGSLPGRKKNETATSV